MAGIEDEFPTGVVQINPPRPDEDAVSEYMRDFDLRELADEDQLWREMLGTESGQDGNQGGTPGQPRANGLQQEPNREEVYDLPQPDRPAELTENRDYVGDAVSDFGRGLTEAPGQVVGGVVDAIDEAGQLVSEVTGFGGIQLFDENEDGSLESFNPKILSLEEFEAAGGDDIINFLSVDPPESATGGFIRATAQFLTGFIPATKAVKALGVANSFAVAFSAGAIADAVVFDPHEDRLSTFLNEIPALEPFVFDYLADNNPDNESSWEGRMKNAIEGTLLGLTAEAAGALFRSFKYYKIQRTERAQLTSEAPSVQAQAARDRLRSAAREEFIQDIPDSALANLGDPNGPRLMSFDAMEEGETTIQAHLRIAEAEERAAVSLERNDALARINAVTEAAQARMGGGDTPEDTFGALLDATRGQNTPSVGGKAPVSTIIKGLGGIDPASGMAAELRNLGITSRTHPGLFRRGGLSNLDNIPVSDQPLFSARDLDDGNGFVPEQAWIDAMRDEVAGNPWRSLDEQARYADEVQPIEELTEELQRLGIDPDTMSNATIRQRLDEIAAEGETSTLPERAEAQSSVDPADRVFVNHSRINTPEDVHAALQEMADMDSSAIADKTRGVVSNEQTIRESSQEYQDLDDLIGRPPGPMTAAQATAARRLLVSSGEQIVELAQRASALDASPADLFNFRRALAVHYSIQSEVIAARTETARALQSWAIPANETRARSQAINELIMQNGGSGDIQKLAREMSAVGENPIAVNAIARDVGRGKFGRAIYQVWINAILSSPKTHMVNILSNSLVAAYSIPERYLAAGISKAFYNGEIDVGEAAANMFAVVKGSREGLRLMWHGNNAEGMEGISDVFDAFGKTEIHTNAISAEVFGMRSEGSFGRGIDFLGRAVNVPGSLLQTEDKFFKALGYRMELNSLAYRTAISEGLEGEEAAARMVDILRNPPDSLRADAIDAAHYRTFTNQLGDIGQKFMTARSAIPGGRIVLPFVRTATNIVKYTFARTPLAYMSGAIRAEISAGGARAAQAHARVGLGSTLMLVVADMTLEGTITGRGPTDSRLRAAKMDTGWMPYSVRVGDRWYQYSRTDPIGMMMGMGADVAELTTNANGEDSEMMATAVVLALANNLANKTYMTGIYDFIGAIDPSNPTNTPEKYLSDFSGSMVPYSSFLRNMASAGDTIVRETRGSVYGEDGKVDPVATYIENTIDNIRRAIPGMGADLPPRRDLYGEPIDRASGLGWGYDFLSPISSRADDPDPVTQVILDNQIRISNVPRMIQGVALSSEQYSEFSRMAGQPLKEHLDRLIVSPGFQRLSDGPDGMKAEVIRSAVNSFRDRARVMMMREYPDLQRLSYMRQLERAQILQGEQN